MFSAAILFVRTFFTGAFKFFATPLGRKVLIAAAIAVALWFVYSWIHEDGETEGYAKGVASQKALLEAKDVEIKRLAGIINTKREADKTKGDNLTAGANAEVITSQEKQAISQSDRNKIIADYKRNNPTTSAPVGPPLPGSAPTRCFLRPATLTAINALLETQIGYEKNNDVAPETFPDAKPSTPPQPDSPDKPPSASVGDVQEPVVTTNPAEVNDEPTT